MTQPERRLWLIEWLLRERGEALPIPGEAEEQQRLLRALLNLRPPMPASADFLPVQDAYLQEAIAQKGITDAVSFTRGKNGLYLWRGDIVTLRCDAIVNAANSALLGCFYPCHGCIDNAIHTFAGVQLRLCCQRLMQGGQDPVGRARITPGFNLPARYVLHTVGPCIAGKPTRLEREQLAACYRSCLTLAREKGLTSVALCCISTGEFHFPPEAAAQIALETVRPFSSQMQVILNVLRERDQSIYQRLLGAAEA